MTTKLALRSPVSLFPSESEWNMLKEQASMMVKTGFLPRTIDTPEKAIAIALKGRELGIPPMQAFSHIHIIDGKPTISAELMLSQIWKHCPKAVIDYLESTDMKCVIEAKRPGHKATKFAYTIDEANKAGLLNKANWRGYPAAMLRARTVAIVARALFPDAIMGCSHIPEELGAIVDEEGVVLELPAADASNSIVSTTPEAKPAAEPKKKSRKVLGAEIMDAANELCLDKKAIEKWAQSDFKKSAKDLTIEEMETFLGTLQIEIGSRGEKS
jgi:hypothetical protein